MNLKLSILLLNLQNLKSILPILALLLLVSCDSNTKHSPSTYKYQDSIYYRLIAFDKDEHFEKGQTCQLNAVFCRQNDSVFWDSRNSLNNQYFLETNQEPSNFLNSIVDRSSLGDSVELLVPVSKFFREIFQTSNLPYFVGTDSVVKIRFRICEPGNKSADSLRGQLQKAEFAQIEAYFGDPQKFENARDSLGFYWIDGREDLIAGEGVKYGTSLRLVFKGSFLNGRTLDASAQKLDFVYGTPDQVLPGINYVIGRMKLGQNAKIILPSRLAFGQFGSSNGSVGPYTPLIYELQVLAIN